MNDLLLNINFAAINGFSINNYFYKNKNLAKNELITKINTEINILSNDFNKIKFIDSLFEEVSSYYESSSMLLTNISIKNTDKQKGNIYKEIKSIIYDKYEKVLFKIKPDFDKFEYDEKVKKFIDLFGPKTLEIYSEDYSIIKLSIQNFNKYNIRHNKLLTIADFILSNENSKEIAKKRELILSILPINKVQAEIYNINIKSHLKNKILDIQNNIKKSYKDKPKHNNPEYKNKKETIFEIKVDIDSYLKPVSLEELKNIITNKIYEETYVKVIEDNLFLKNIENEIKKLENIEKAIKIVDGIPLFNESKICEYYKVIHQTEYLKFLTDLKVKIVRYLKCDIKMPIFDYLFPSKINKFITQGKINLPADKKGDKEIKSSNEIENIITENIVNKEQIALSAQQQSLDRKNKIKPIMNIELFIKSLFFDYEIDNKICEEFIKLVKGHHQKTINEKILWLSKQYLLLYIIQNLEYHKIINIEANKFIIDNFIFSKHNPIKKQYLQVLNGKYTNKTEKIKTDIQEKFNDFINNDKPVSNNKLNITTLK